MDRHRLFSNWRLWLLAACSVAAAAFLLLVDWKERFVSDVSELLPAAGSGNQESDLLTRIRQQEEGLVLGVLLPPQEGWGGAREEMTAMFLQTLRNSGQFEKVATGAGPSDPEKVAAAVYEGRLDLLLPQWANKAGIAADEADATAWANAIVRSLEIFLSQPEATAFADLLPADPFPLVAYMANAAPTALQEPDTAGPLPFWAVQSASPFKPEGQGPVFAAIERAADAAAKVAPGSRVRHASVARFAAASEDRIRSEITWLNGIGIVLVAAVALLFLRRRVVLLHLLVLAAMAVVGGFAGTLLVFPSVHILTLVVGGLLVGVAVDYGIHLLLHRPRAPGAGFHEVLREVRKPLLASALSTAAGFGALFFAELPLLRQIGVFVAAGLLSALAACWIYLPLWPRREALSSLAVPRQTSRRRWLFPVAVAVFLLPLAGWLRLDWHDDIRELQPPMEEIWKADAEVRRLVAGDGESVSWICAGESLREARTNLASFEARWAESGGERENLLSLSPWVAEPEANDAVRAAFEQMPNFENVLRNELETAGFEADAFAPFFEELESWLSPDAPTYRDRVAALASALDGPSGLLLQHSVDHAFFLVSAPREAVPPNWTPPPGTVSTTQVESLNELFSQYRQTAWRLSGISFGVIAIGVLLLYGKSAGTVLVLPCLAWAWGLGVLGGVASPLSLFHVLGSFLGFCVALDYGLFFHHARRSQDILPGSIRVSAATTLSAFGVLSLASIPAVAALGRSVFLVVFAALFLVEVANLFRSTKTAS